MPFSSSIVAPRRIILTRATGTIGYRDFVEHYVELPEQPGYDATYDELIDLSDADRVDLSAKEIQQFARMMVESADPCINVRIAVIAPGDLEFALGRMYELYAVNNGTLTVRVFRGRQEANTWIGLPPD